MAEATKLPVRTKEKEGERLPTLQAWRPFESFRQEMDRLFGDFSQDFSRLPVRRPFFDIQPLWRRELRWDRAPAVDIVERDDAFEMTAELPGMDEKNIEVKLANGILTIKGEKQEEKEEKKKDYYLHERDFGVFERCFVVPDGVDTSKIEASFKKGVLTVTLPKKPEAKKAEKKIEIKAA